jgi:hypothetical protein
MKKIIIILTILFNISVYSQEKISYNTKDGLINFDISKKLIFIETKEPISNFSDEKIVNEEETFIIIETIDKDYVKKTETLKSKFTTVEPVLIYKDGTKQVCFNEIIIKIKPEYDIDQILINQNYKSIINQFDKNQYLIKLNNSDTNKTFNLINSLSKDNRIEFIEPNFLILDAFQTNDPYYSSQWAINNNGYLGGMPDADMDVDEAWTLSTGSGIKVAVLDVGVDLSHPDLQANLLSGHDAINGVVGGGYIGASYHGTPCAGIIGAVANNNIGISGVAYNSKIIPIRVGTGTSITTSAAVAGINWASNNGADVLSNSWRLGSVSAAVNNAINYAVTSGRNGKGTIIVFSSGNENGAVGYPANVNPKIIVVGAITSGGIRSSFSNYGSQLDVVAPGSGILSTMLNNTTGYLDGTSMATPHVAGVCALILSVNPCLTNQQVRDIIEQTSQKVGGYSYTITTGRSNGTWNNQMGYGLIDAYAAVQMAQSMSSIAQISGNDTLCNTENYSAPAGGTSYNWTITQGANLVTLTGNGTANVTLTALPNASGQVTLSLIMGGNCGNQIGTKAIVVGGNTTFTGYYVNNYGQNAELKNNQNYYVNLVQSYTNTTVYTSELPSATWSLLYGSCNFWTQFPEGGGGAILLMNLPQSGDIVAFRLTYDNSCGVSEYQDFWFTAVSSSSYMMSPNPTNDNLTVAVVEKTSADQKNVSNDSQDIREINIVDKTGIIRIKQSYIKGTKQMDMDISALSPDVYIVNIFDGNQWTPLKLIKK